MKTPNPDIDSVRQEWRRERERNGLSQAKAGNEIGEDQATISRFERGRRPRDGTAKYEEQIQLWKKQRGELIQVREATANYPTHPREAVAKKLQNLALILMDPSFSNNTAAKELTNFIEGISDNLPGIIQAFHNHTEHNK